MCGILWAQTTEPSLPAVRAAFDTIKHRGPDHTGVKVVEPGHGASEEGQVHEEGRVHFMGTHRLAITNLDPAGNQPLEYAGHTLICNGQIYNYQQLAQQQTLVSGLRTDVDIILKALDRFETLADLCRALDGDFAFVLLHRDGGVHIARDPVGVRPLFYGLDERDRVTCAGSEAKALQRIPGVQTVKVFPPGHVFDARAGAFHSYTDVYGCSEPAAQLPCGEPVAQQYAEAVARVRSLVRSAVEKRVGNSDRPVGFLCSGGIDSSIVLALACELLEDRSKVRVFSMEYGEGSSEDAFYASLLAMEFGVSHTRVRFSFDDVRSCIYSVARQIESYDPNTIRASVPMYLLAKYIREHTDCTVILSGEGADELFMGYNLFLRSTDGQMANAESQRLIRNIHMFDGLRADRCFNAHGLEVRMPFLDRDLIREVLGMDASHKMPRNRIEKALLRDAFRHLPELGRTRILDRGKERFSDGCGYSYVPALLSHWTPAHVPHASALETKEACEAWVYQQWFDKAYPGLRHLVVKRELPAWCGKSQGTAQGILGMSEELNGAAGKQAASTVVVDAADTADKADTADTVETVDAPPGLTGTLYGDCFEKYNRVSQQALANEDPAQQQQQQQQQPQPQPPASMIDPFLQGIVHNLLVEQRLNMLDKTKCSTSARNIYNYLCGAGSMQHNNNLSQQAPNLPELASALSTDTPCVCYVHFDHLTNETSHYFIIIQADKKVMVLQSAVFEHNIDEWLNPERATADAVRRLEEATTTVQASADLQATGMSKDAGDSCALEKLQTDYARQCSIHKSVALEQLQRDHARQCRIYESIRACRFSSGRTHDLATFVEHFVPLLQSLEGVWTEEDLPARCRTYQALFACDLPMDLIRAQVKMGIKPASVKFVSAPLRGGPALPHTPRRCLAG